MNWNKKSPGKIGIGRDAKGEFIVIGTKKTYTKSARIYNRAPRRFGE